MQIFEQSHNATIYSFPKSTNAVYLETDTMILLFFSIKHLGFFQQILNPFIFIKTDKELDLEYKNTRIIRNFKLIEKEGNRTIIFPNKYGIKELIIPMQMSS